MQNNEVIRLLEGRASSLDSDKLLSSDIEAVPYLWLRNHITSVSESSGYRIDLSLNCNVH